MANPMPPLPARANAALDAIADELGLLYQDVGRMVPADGGGEWGNLLDRVQQLCHDVEQVSSRDARHRAGEPDLLTIMEGNNAA